MNSAIFLKAIENYLPENRISIEKIAKKERFLRDVDDLKNKFGFQQVCVSSHKTCSEMAIQASQKLLDNHQNIDIAEIDTLIYCHFWQEPSWEKLHCFTIQEKLCMRPDAEVFELTVGNGNSLFYAVKIGALMLNDQTQKRKNVMIIGADKLNERLIPRKMAEGIVGDGAVAMVLSSHAEHICEAISPILHTSFPEFNSVTEKRPEYFKKMGKSLVRGTVDITKRLLTLMDVKSKDVSFAVSHNSQIDRLKHTLDELGLSSSILWTQSIGEIGIVPSCAPFINYSLLRNDAAPKGPVLIIGNAIGASAYVMLCGHLE